ncbi:MAG TPA: DNA polymerase III subunit beta, partial [bacterium]|nr:DNA polymerase III subunit beta [bacterium]
MKVALLQENLAKALNHVAKAISTRPSIPVLSNVLIEAKKGKLKLSSTDLEIGINAWIGADVEEDGEVTVSARLLSEFINSLKSGKVMMSSVKNTLLVESVDNSAE